MRIFVDASAWVPLQVPRDQHSRRLAQIVGTLVDRDLALVTTNWTLYEALALAARWGHEHATRLHRRATRQATVKSVDSDTEAEAFRRFLSWQDKTASVVDYANLLVALDADCAAILSFDEDFAPLARQAGIDEM